MLDHHELPRREGDRHRPRGRHLAGDLLPVLRRRRGGHPRAGRGDGAAGPAPHRDHHRRVVGGRRRLRHVARAGRRVPRVLGRPPPGAAGDGPRHRRGRRPLPEDPRPPAQRHHQGAGRRHPRGRRRPAASPRASTRWRWPAPLVSMLAHTAAHQYGFEFWGIRTAKLREAMARQVSWSSPASPPSRRCRSRSGLLPPYRLGVASDPAWMGAFARHADEVGFESLLAVEHVAVPVGLREPLPVQRHRPHAAARGLRAARSARPARLAGGPHRAHPARHRHPRAPRAPPAPARQALRHDRPPLRRPPVPRRRRRLDARGGRGPRHRPRRARHAAPTRRSTPSA